jgi:hypothetical protein
LIDEKRFKRQETIPDNLFKGSIVDSLSPKPLKSKKNGFVAQSDWIDDLIHTARSMDTQNVTNSAVKEVMNEYGLEYEQSEDQFAKNQVNQTICHFVLLY